MNYDIGACKNCAHIAAINKDHTCSVCGVKRESVPLYTWFHQEYDLIEDKETIDKMDTMDNTEVKAAAVGGAELKAGLRDLFICLGAAVVLLLFGLLCMKGASGSVKGRMSFMGLLLLIGSPLALLAGVGLFFKRVFARVRAKTPEKAFDLFWTAVFETKTFSEKYETEEIALNKITRSLPGAVRQTLDGRKTMFWIEDLRNMISRSNAELALDCYSAYKDQIYDAKGDGDSLTIQNVSVQNVDDHKAIVSADLVVARKWSRSIQKRNDSDTFNYWVSAAVLHAKTTLLKAGEYWYVPDWMPKAEKGTLTDAWKEANA